MTEKRIVFHIGMPKCGSTYLQRLIFPRLPGVHYEKTGGSELGTGSIADRLKRLDAIMASSAADIVLVSAESLCGHPANKASYRDFEEFLPHVRDRYPVTVLVIVRRQDSFIDSMYRHHIRKGGTLDLDEFFSLTREEQKVASKVSDGSMHYSYCDYSRFLRYLKSPDQPDDPTLVVIPFEVMQQDLRAFVRRVAAAVGVTGAFEIPNTVVNRGPSQTEFLVRKKLNKIMILRGVGTTIYRKLLVLALHASAMLAKVHDAPVSLLSKADRQRILDHYREGNRQVAALAAKDLYALDYC